MLPLRLSRSAALMLADHKPESPEARAAIEAIEAVQLIRRKQMITKISQRIRAIADEHKHRMQRAA